MYVKRHNRNNKSELLVEEAKLLEANPHYAHVRLENGRGISVTLRDLAPNPSSSSQHHRTIENDVTDVSSQGQIDFAFNEMQNDVCNSVDVLPHCDSEVVNDNDHKDYQLQPGSNSFDCEPLRRPTRVRHPTKRYGNPVHC